MKAVISLNNFWEWSGGFEQFLIWQGIENPDAYDFYTNEAANAHFISFIQTLVTRTNTINGEIYSQDDTIMSWQLANEPRTKNCNEYQTWIKKIAKSI